MSSDVVAEDLGTIGKTYKIIEPDLIETIKKMLEKKKASGELDKLNSDLRDNGKKYVANPPGKELPRAKINRAFAVDPTYTVKTDILKADGSVMYPAGYTYNPLDIKPLTRTLCFINGDDKEQFQWLENHCSNPLLYKRILVHGDYIKASEKTNVRLYFDQNGYLVSHFRIEATPAIVRQEGALLYVQEIKL